MANVIDFEDHGTPAARRALARYLRELADIIAEDASRTEPNAALIVLAGRTQFEVLHIGADTDPGFIRGAILAAQAVHAPNYETVGGNIRPRTHSYGYHRPVADLVPLRSRTPTTQET